MRRLRTYKKSKNTIKYLIFIVFFCVLTNTFILFKIYSNTTTNVSTLLINQKINKVLYQFFSDKITNDIINKENINDILDITTNKNDEILKVDYNLEKTYAVLTNVSNVLKTSISDLENGKIDVSIYDKYLESGKNGLILNIPLFLSSNNIFINNIGPKIPVLINFNETLLTNIKTKVTKYGFNNALLEIYITVNMEKLIITPMYKDKEPFNYDILIAALVVHGSVPEFYGEVIESSSNILDIPIK